MVRIETRYEGALRWFGARYLRFAGSGEWFLKAGANSPENLLAYEGFDATTPSHRFAPHARDARPGDPTWRGGRGASLAGALNYLAGKGMNSVYFLTMNVGGDGDDVWPWTRRDAHDRGQDQDGRQRFVQVMQPERRPAEERPGNGTGGRERDREARSPGWLRHHMFRLYSPPTSYSAWLICPRLWVLTASTRAAKTFPRLRAVS